MARMWFALAAVSHQNSKVGSNLGLTFKHKVAMRMTFEDQRKASVMAKNCSFSEYSKCEHFDLAVLNRDNPERFSAS